MELKPGEKQSVIQQSWQALTEQQVESAGSIRRWSWEGCVLLQASSRPWPSPGKPAPACITHSVTSPPPSAGKHSGTLTSLLTSCLPLNTAFSCSSNSEQISQQFILENAFDEVRRDTDIVCKFSQSCFANPGILLMRPI